MTDIEQIRTLDDRIEAAAKRERDEIEANALAVGGVVEASRKREMSKNASKNGADFGQLGNAAAMREALVMVKRLFDGRIMFQPAIRKAHKAVDAALSLPPRQCDVGTADEQFERWNAFCTKYDDDCTGCPCDCDSCVSFTNCFSKWELMPYEEGGAK